MKISEFLSPTETLLNVRASDKEQLLQELARNAASKVKLSEGDIVTELLKRNSSRPVSSDRKAFWNYGTT